ncbi:hypothetical protein [Methanocaldococcus sp.]|uniref:hypothetical protein n=1 Tax=Methanocaldococcus sp. TaxID=2152917 RepID=UPI00261E37E2|nr:hypothetical protein [Methanocaldococcus sp.]MCQ6254256.1 hypothetical protein [Methanocaldococcus sp.]
MLDISLYYPSILAFIIGVFIGAKYRMKIKNIFGYLVLSIVIAYFLKAFPYYNLPLSLTFVSSVIGIILGNRVFGGKMS